MKKLMLSLSAALCTFAAVAQTTPAAPAKAHGGHHGHHAHHTGTHHKK
ncbi:hypothetical protein [Hymenobacter terricola]|nr:hypothetical protein [Hymenobacter terricola]